MQINNTDSVEIVDCIDEYIHQLFPAHSKFFLLNTRNCEILKHKKICLDNHLNWLGEKKWPNQSVNQYAEYQTYTIALQEFIHSVTEEKTTFFYSDLTDTCDEKTLNEELNDLFSLKTNTLILFRANIKLDTQTLINAKIWSTTQTTLIDISAKSHFVVLYNYTIKNPLLNSRALTPDKKQQLKRKAFRWQQNFQQMNETEKKLIINTLLSQLYQNNKT